MFWNTKRILHTLFATVGFLKFVKYLSKHVSDCDIKIKVDSSRGRIRLSGFRKSFRQVFLENFTQKTLKLLFNNIIFL